MIQTLFDFAKEQEIEVGTFEEFSKLLQSFEITELTDMEEFHEIVIECFEDFPEFLQDVIDLYILGYKSTIKWEKAVEVCPELIQYEKILGESYPKLKQKQMMYRDILISWNLIVPQTICNEILDWIENQPKIKR